MIKAITRTLFSVALLLSLILNLYLILDDGNSGDGNIIGELIHEGNITYRQVLSNYYDVEYANNGDGLVLRIKNPCVTVLKSHGLSMKPYWDNNTLGIFDTCFPKENLKIGDVITYNGELDSTVDPHHRIVEIDYEKEWVRTQGDNPKTNPRPDDFVGFGRIRAKEIGVLNVLEDKKIIKKEIINSTEGGFLATGNWSMKLVRFRVCVCSSSGHLRFCYPDKTMLDEDTFIQQNDLKEEYCKHEETPRTHALFSCNGGI